MINLEKRKNQETDFLIGVKVANPNSPSNLGLETDIRNLWSIPDPSAKYQLQVEPCEIPLKAGAPRSDD